MEEISKHFIITPKGYERGYDSESFQRMAHDIQRHHYNDDFHLYVGAHFKDRTLVGIFVLSDEQTIDWFVKYWVEQGILKEDTETTEQEEAPCEINGFEF